VPLATHGVIAEPEGLFPCLFVGTALDVSVDIRSLSGLRPGQLILQHQYGGAQCLHATLLGIVLPLSACDDPAVVAALGRVADRYSCDPFVHWDPTLDEVVEVRDALLEVGPLDCSTTYVGVAEAFLPFDFRKAYGWLRDHFRMTTAVDDPGFPEPARVAGTEPLPWESWESFLAWLREGQADALFHGGVGGLFLYENSD
jgi:hypothetical protein